MKSTPTPPRLPSLMHLMCLTLGCWALNSLIPLTEFAYGQLWDTPLGLVAANLPFGSVAAVECFTYLKMRPYFSGAYLTILYLMPVLMLATPPTIVIISMIVG